MVKVPVFTHEKSPAGRTGGAFRNSVKSVTDDHVQNASGAVADQQIFTANADPVGAERRTGQTVTVPIIDENEAAIFRNKPVTAHPAMRARNVAHHVIVART